jgi:NADH dehydrogenase FAD-containing subunit
MSWLDSGSASSANDYDDVLDNMVDSQEPDEVPLGMRFVVEVLKQIDLSSDTLHQIERFVHLMRQPFYGVPVKDRKQYLKLNEKCFIASECVLWIREKLNITTSDAIKVGIVLQRLKYLEHVNSNSTFKNESLFFKFSKKKRIVVLGGGFAGSWIANELKKDPYFQIVLIDSSISFENRTALPQLIRNSSKTMTIMHSDFLDTKETTIIHDQISEITPYAVMLNVEKDIDGNVVPSDKIKCNLLDEDQYYVETNGRHVFYDYLIVATGSRAHSRYDSDVVTNPYDRDSIVKTKWQQAKKIAVIGGGPVAIEVTMEIVAVAPTVEVFLITQQDRLIHNINPTASKRAFEYMKKFPKIKIMTSCNVLCINGRNIHYKNNSVESTLEDLDVIIPCTGQQPNTEMFSKHMSHSLNKEKYVYVNQHFQVRKSHNECYNNVFAIGDIADARELRTAYIAEKHAAHVLHVIRQMEISNPVMQKYAFEREPFMVLSMGNGKSITVKEGRMTLDGGLASMPAKEVQEKKKVTGLKLFL